MPTLQLLQAAVKYAASPPKDFGSGPRINVVCSLPSGEDAKIWGNPDDPLSALRRGEKVTLIYDGRNYKLASSDAPEPSREAAEPAIAEASQPADYPAKLGQAAANYELAWKTATAIIKRSGVNPDRFDIIQRVASDLFHAAI